MKMLRFIYVLIIFETLIDCHPREGPYKSIITSIENCKNSSNSSTSPITYELEPYFLGKKQLIRGNISCRSPVVNKISLTQYTYEQGVHVKNFQFKNMNCRTTFMQAVCKAVNVKYDRRTCKLYPGNYSFQYFDYDYMSHVAIHSRVYEKTELEFEATSKKGTDACVLIKLDTVPLNETA